jgi:hypothetical protein
MKKLSQMWFTTQRVPFPFLEKEIEEPLTEKLKQVVTTLELIRIEDYVYIPGYWHGQSPGNRKEITRSFIAKAVYNWAVQKSLFWRNFHSRKMAPSSNLGNYLMPV